MALVAFSDNLTKKKKNDKIQYRYFYGIKFLGVIIVSKVGHFSVLDNKSTQFFPVFTAKNAEVARRSLVQSFTRDSILVQYPKDFILWHLCDFDDESGEIFSLDVHEVCNVVDLIPDELKQFALDGSFIKE